MRRAVGILAIALASCVKAGAPPRVALPAAAPGRILLVRHAESWKNLPDHGGKPSDQLDDLTPKGAGEAVALGAMLGGRGITAVASSPAQRARKTAQPIADSARVSLVVDDALALPGLLETTEQMATRLANAIASHRKAAPEGVLVVVTHGDLIAAFVGGIAGTPARKRERKNMPPVGSVTEIGIDAEGRWTLGATGVVP